MKDDGLGQPLPCQRADSPGLREALRALTLRRGPPTDADRPPLSTFPMTAGAAEARRYDRDLAER